MSTCCAASGLGAGRPANARGLGDPRKLLRQHQASSGRKGAPPSSFGSLDEAELPQGPHRTKRKALANTRETEPACSAVAARGDSAQLLDPLPANAPRCTLVLPIRRALQMTVLHSFL